MNYFSIASLFKLEEPYIGDWVKYHLGIGAEHIYLYDNDSPDQSAKIAREVGGDRVTIERCPGHPVQHMAHARCISDHRLDSRWIAFIDIDEYLVPKKPIGDLLHEYEKYPALCAHWVLFGSNDLLDYDPRPVPVRFTRCEPGTNIHVKSIVNPVETGNWITAHRFTHPRSPVDENKKPIGMLDSTPAGGTSNIIYVAHFSTKSKAECYERRARPRPDIGEIRYDVPEFFRAHDRNERENLDVLNLWNGL